MDQQNPPQPALPLNPKAQPAIPHAEQPLAAEKWPGSEGYEERNKGLSLDHS